MTNRLHRTSLSGRIGRLARRTTPLALLLLLLASCGEDGEPAASATERSTESGDTRSTDSGTSATPTSATPTSGHSTVDSVPSSMTELPTDSRTSTTPSGVSPNGSGSGTTSTPQCAPPEPRFGSSAESLALAAAPARCGVSTYAWRPAAEVGDVTAARGSGTFTAGVLRGALRAEDIDPPEQPRLNTRWQKLTYTTQDRGEVVEATTLLAWAPTVEPDAPILLLLHGTSGFTDGCGINDELGWRALASYFASIGYIVVSPDYLGLRMDGEESGFPHPYLVGEPTAIASLDAVRASLRWLHERDAALCPSERVVMLGASQGGHAALWVDRLAGHYAAEFTMIGGVATVPPADLLLQVRPALQEFISATGNTVAFFGTAPAWYGVEDRLDEIFLPPWDEDVPALLAASCSPRPDRDLPSELDEAFSASLLEAAENDTLQDLDPWGCMLEENSLTRTTIPRPDYAAPEYGLLWVLGENDTLVSSPVSRTSAETLCTLGLPIELIECAGASHTRATFYALPEIYRYLGDRVAGLAPSPPTTCTFPAAEVCEGTPEDD